VDPKVTFFFYLAAVVCFVLAAAGESWKYGGRGRRGLTPRLVLVPLGLALWLFPTLWTAGVTAF
jgi:hypothetical protein